MESACLTLQGVPDSSYSWCDRAFLQVGIDAPIQSIQEPVLVSGVSASSASFHPPSCSICFVMEYLCRSMARIVAQEVQRFQQGLPATVRINQLAMATDCKRNDL